MDQEIDFILANVQNNKITDVDSFKDILRNFLKLQNDSIKVNSLLATKLFDDDKSFLSYLELRNSNSDTLTKSIKKAISQFVVTFIKERPQFVNPYIEQIFVSS